MPAPGKSFSPIDSVLIVRTGAIGDVVNALAFANAVRDGFPEARVGWVTHDLVAPLVTGHPSVDSVHLWRRGSGLRGFRALVSELRAGHYDLAVDLQRLQKSAALCRLSGARRRLSYDRSRSKEQSWLWGGERLPIGAPESHMLDQYMEFASHLGLPATPRRSLPLKPDAEAFADDLLRSLGAPPLLINLGASKPANRWPAERFGHLARQLAAAGRGPVCLIGGPDDREAAAQALAAAGPGAAIRDLAGSTDLPQLISLLRRARLFVGCDTGPMHLAAALEVPLLALFGPADERRTGPYGWDRPGLVRSPAPRVLRLTPECAPCGAKHCPLERRACMLDIDVDAVLAAALAQLDA